jgi:hypothetical protein
VQLQIIAHHWGLRESQWQMNIGALVSTWSICEERMAGTHCFKF